MMKRTSKHIGFGSRSEAVAFMAGLMYAWACVDESDAAYRIVEVDDEWQVRLYDWSSDQAQGEDVLFYEHAMPSSNMEDDDEADDDAECYPDDNEDDDDDNADVDDNEFRR